MAQWGKVDDANNAPNYIPAAEAGDVYFVDETEAGIAANKAKGLGTPGWNKYTTYTDCDGATRHRAESLVPMKVSAGDAGDLGAAGNTTVEDATVADS